MKTIPVSSSAISHIGYDSITKQMKVTFKQGITYDYCGVPKHIYEAFVSAQSIGRYYHTHIEDKYNCF